MTLITCSDNKIETMRLLSTFHKYHPQDRMIWIIADTNEIDNSLLEKTINYYGKDVLAIHVHKIDNQFWANNGKECLYLPRWQLFKLYADAIPDDEIIIVSDATDVVFQKPVNSDDISDDEIIVGDANETYEGKGIPNAWWSKRYQDMYYRFPVVCAGFIMAKNKTFKNIASVMVNNKNTEIYSDQNLLQVVCDSLKIKMNDTPNVIGTALKRNIEKREDGYFYIDGMASSAIHCCGRMVDNRMDMVLEDSFPYSELKRIEADILGESL